MDRANKYGEVGYWILGSFAGIMFFPTVLVFLGSIPTYYALYKGLSEGASELNALDYVATVIAVGAAIIQVCIIPMHDVTFLAQCYQTYDSN